MGRPKSYDREEVAGKAMELFWKQGFHATSTKTLAEHMGINVYSLFAEFESKQGLYEAALTVYVRDVVTRHFSKLETPDAGIRELVQVIEFFASAAGEPGSEQGCFLCNAATERAAIDPGSKEFVDAYVERIQQAIQNTLKNAKERGELRPEVSCEDQSRMLTSTLLGFSVLMRAGVDREVIAGAARAACSALERMRV